MCTRMDSLATDSDERQGAEVSTHPGRLSCDLVWRPQSTRWRRCGPDPACRGDPGELGPRRRRRRSRWPAEVSYFRGDDDDRGPMDRVAVRDRVRPRQPASDLVYEGAPSVTVVGVVTGVGEAFALAGRLGTGPLVDRTRAYWPLILIGYAVTMVAVLTLGLTSVLWIAAVLVVGERVARRSAAPPRT